MKPSPKSSVIMAISDTAGDLRMRILRGKERQSFGMAPDVNVQTEHSTTARGAIHSDQRLALPLVQCREEKESVPPPAVPGRLNSLPQAHPRNYWGFSVLTSPNLT